MKIVPARIAAFLERPDPAVVAVLVYGPDRGLVRERADLLAATVVDDPDDPFRVTDMAAAQVADDPARLADEAAALALGGGRRLVRVRDAGDGVAKVFEAFLDGAEAGGTLVVAEAGDLGPRSALRRVFERAANAAALPCYADDARTLRQVVSETLGSHGQSATPEALEYLAAHLGSDRLVTRNELEKLALYKGAPGTVGLDDVLACVGDSAATSLDDVAVAAAAGDQAGLDRALQRAFQEGNHPVGVLRAAARHLQRLHLAAGLIAAGKTPEQAMAALRPPVFFKLADAFRGQLRRWPGGRLAEALEIVTVAELDCKTSGQPAEAVCGRALMRIAQQAARQTRAGA